MCNWSSSIWSRRPSVEFYSAVKLVHVLSAALLIGVGAGSAFFLWQILSTVAVTRGAAVPTR